MSAGGTFNDPSKATFIQDPLVLPPIGFRKKHSISDGVLRGLRLVCLHLVRLSSDVELAFEAGMISVLFWTTW